MPQRVAKKTGAMVYFDYAYLLLPEKLGWRG